MSEHTLVGFQRHRFVIARTIRVGAFMYLFPKILNNFGITHLELNVALCGTAQRHEHGWKPPVMNTYGESEREGESKGGVEDLHSSQLQILAKCVLLGQIAHCKMLP